MEYPLRAPKLAEKPAYQKNKKKERKKEDRKELSESRLKIKPILTWQVL